MLRKVGASRLMSDCGYLPTPPFFGPDDDAGNGEHDGQEAQCTDKDSVGQTEDVRLMQGDEPVGDRISGVLAGWE
ncbi:MAG: hypothetical protein NPIRA05_16490 [Nitrospirales bacterium]|nr:MAG: hypothetical protein NPIRA05_16490 [Nitrospirales bacterium]